MEPNYPVQATRNSFRILDALMEAEGATLVELDERLELAKSVIHNHLETLIESGFLQKDEYTYRPSLKFFEYGADVRRGEESFETAREQVDDIAAALGEQVNLVFAERGRGTVVYQQAGERAVNSDIEMGSRLELHCTAAGKAILATSPEAYVDRILGEAEQTSHTRNTITDEATLRAELEEITAEIPWTASDRSERIMGVKCLATPIIDQTEAQKGALSVTIPNHRYREESYREEIVDQLESARSEISLDISYS